MPDYEEDVAFRPKRTGLQTLAAVLEGFADPAGARKRKDAVSMRLLEDRLLRNRTTDEYAMRKELYAAQDKAGAATALERDKQAHRLALDAQKQAAMDARLGRSLDAGYEQFQDRINDKNQGRAQQESQFSRRLGFDENRLGQDLGIKYYAEDKKDSRLQSTLDAGFENRADDRNAADQRQQAGINAGVDQKQYGAAVAATMQERANLARRGFNPAGVAMPQYPAQRNTTGMEWRTPNPVFQAASDQELIKMATIDKEIAETQADTSKTQVMKEGLIKKLLVQRQQASQSKAQHDTNAQIYSQESAPLGTQEPEAPGEIPMSKAQQKAELMRAVAEDQKRHSHKDENDEWQIPTVQQSLDRVLLTRGLVEQHLNNPTNSGGAGQRHVQDDNVSSPPPNPANSGGAGRRHMQDEELQTVDPMEAAYNPAAEPDHVMNDAYGYMKEPAPGVNQVIAGTQPPGMMAQSLDMPMPAPTPTVTTNATPAPREMRAVENPLSMLRPAQDFPGNNGVLRPEDTPVFNPATNRFEQPGQQVAGPEALARQMQAGPEAQSIPAQQVAPVIPSAIPAGSYYSPRNGKYYTPELLAKNAANRNITVPELIRQYGLQEQK